MRHDSTFTSGASSIANAADNVILIGLDGLSSLFTIHILGASPFFTFYSLYWSRELPTFVYIRARAAIIVCLLLQFTDTVCHRDIFWRIMRERAMEIRMMMCVLCLSSGSDFCCFNYGLGSYLCGCKCKKYEWMKFYWSMTSEIYFWINDVLNCQLQLFVFVFSVVSQKCSSRVRIL